MFCLHNKRVPQLIKNGNEYPENYKHLECATFRSSISYQKKQMAKVLNLHDCPFEIGIYSTFLIAWCDWPEV